MNKQPVQIAQSDLNPGKNELGSNGDPTIQPKPLISMSSSMTSPATGSGAANGRVLPVVYVKVPQRELLPNVSRSGTLISTLNQKISTAPTISSPPMLISTTSNPSCSSALASGQQGFVTLQGSLRSVSQTGATTSTLAPSQPHIITLPKGSNTALLTLQSASGTGQVVPGHQQQYVTIQGPLVAKTQGNTSLNPGPMQPQYVTIRTPVLTTSAAKGTTGTPSHYVTIQAPVLQAGSTSTPTFLPVSAVGAPPTATKPPVTYQVLKSNPKTRDQHIVYPLPVTNYLQNPQQKMLLTPVSVMPKLPVAQTGTSLSVTSSSDIVTSAASISGSKSVSNVAVVKTNNVTVVSPKVLSNVKGLLQAKSPQSQSLLKEPVPLLPNSESLVPTSQQIKMNSNSMPAAISVGLPATSNLSSPGFINITIANGHIQPNAAKESNCVAVSTACENTNKVSKDTVVIREANKNLPDSTTKSELTNLTCISEESRPEQSVKKNNIDDEIKALSDVISISSILQSNTVHYNDSLNQKNVCDSTQSEKIEGEKSTEKINLATCLDGGIKEGETSKIEESKANPSPTSPLDLFCNDDITLVKLSPSDEPPVAKFTVKMMENTDDEVKIELVRDDENSKEKREPLLLQRVEDKTPHKPLLLKNSSKMNSGTSSKGGQSLIKNPANMQSILFKGSKSSKIKLKSSSILKRQASKIKVEDIDSDIKDTEGCTRVSSDSDVKIENPSSPITSNAFGDFDAVDALEWKNGIGLLPGSNLKFRMNEFGLMEIVSDDDDKSEKDRKEFDKDPSSPGSEHLLIDDGSNSSAENKSSKDKKGLDDIFCCEVCRVYGLASEFLNSRFCTQACSALHTVQQAWQYKREQDLRALRLRRKKRRLEQRLARTKEDQDVKDEDTKPDLKKLKLEMQESASELEHMLSYPEPLEDSTPQFSATQDEAALSDSNKNDKKERPYSKGNFSWKKYLEMVQAKAASCTLFKEPLDRRHYEHGFKVGMKLEGIDPQNPAVFCVLSVSEVKGYRLRLHFDGYPDNYDFWVNADSPDIFPARWCEKHNRKVTPPKGFAAPFNWGSYLKSCKGVVAPKHLFNPTSNFPKHPFRVGMKLEAVDRKNLSLVCVASVADVLENRFLVHFDSWDEMYDYWVEPSSPYIHPIGWCDKNKVTLTPPSHFKDSALFSWEKYLKETKALPSPARAFKPRYPKGFRRNLRIEAVDKRVPHLIRVATVSDIDKHRIRIRFDGWPDDYSYWVDDDNPDIHYPGWCADTSHPLEPPLSEEDMRVLAKCGIPGCKGEGHIKGPKFSTHNSAQNCPYAPENIKKDSFLPERLSGVHDLFYLDDSPSKERRSSNRVAKKGWLPYQQGQADLRRGRSGLSDDEDEDSSKSSLVTSMQQKLQSELERSVIDPGYQIETGVGHSACWAKHSQPLQSSYIDSATNPNSWNVQDVVDFLSSISCLEGYEKMFRDQVIDGEALLLLTQNDLISNMNLKLGHAITLYNCIVLLRQKCV